MVRHLENARTCIEGNYYSIVIESVIRFAVEGIENKRDLPSRALRTIVRFVTETRVLSVYEILAASAAPFLDTHSTSIQDR